MNVEIQFLVQMFVKHGHKIIFLEILVKEYNNSNKKKRQLHQLKKKIPWAPNIGPKIRKELKKVKKEVTFTYGKNLKSILCENSTKILRNSHPGV